MMLGRNRALLISSLGLALISILAFGWLFGSGGSAQLRLGIVNSDSSPLATQLAAQLRQSASLRVSSGAQADELRALREGHRDAVLVLGAGFGADLQRGHATVQVYYDQSNPVTQAVTRTTVQSIIAGLNQQATGSAAPVTIAEQAVSVRNLRQIDWLTPGMLGMLLMWANLTVGVVLVAWRQQGIMRRLAATPLRPGVLMGSQMLARLVLSLAQGAVLLGLALLVFHVQVIGSWALLGLTVALGSLTMMSLGFIAASFAKTPEAAQSVTFLVSFPMMFLGGSYFPTDSAPSFLMPVIKALPLSYLNDALRQIINNGASLQVIQTDLLVLLAWMIAALLFSTRAFRWP